MSYKCRATQRAYQREWCKKRRQEYFVGALCVYCHTSKNLEVNHIVPLAREPRHGRHRFWSRRREVIEAELANCEPACRSCNQAHALATGVGRPGAKLSTADVQAIREQERAKSDKELAQQYGVGVQAIRDVRAYRTFKEVPETHRNRRVQHDLRSEAA